MPESHFVQFYKIEPENKVGVVTVKCTKLEPETTQVQVTYKYMDNLLLFSKFRPEKQCRKYRTGQNQRPTEIKNTLHAQHVQNGS